MVKESGRKPSYERVWAFILVLVIIGSAFMSIIGNVAANRGGSDAYGYEWTDSKSPSPTVSYNWIEINTTGTASTIWGDDQSGGPYAVGFTFSFYGNAYTQLYFSTNGLITFGSGSSAYNNNWIPNTNLPNNFLAPYWDDLYVQSGIGTVYYQTQGSAPNQQFIVEWDQVRLLGGSNYMKFEAVLYETGEIWFQYDSLNGETGSYASVGIEDASGTDGSQYSYSVASLSDSLAIRFSPGPFGIGPGQSGSGMVGTTVSYDLTVHNRQAFTDSFDLVGASVLGWSVDFYDSTGTVLLTDTNGDPQGYPNTGNVPAGGAFDFVAKVGIPLSPGGSQDIETITAISFDDNLLNRSLTLTTDVVPAQFDPPHADYGQDVNADGFFDYLVVDVHVDVDIDGFYYILGTLRDNLLNFIDQDYNWTYLSAGAQTVELSFEGSLIYMHGADGPYNISLSLRDDSFNLTDADSYLTNSYAWTQFARPSTFDPPYSDYGVDGDADGLFEYLAISVSVNIISPGDYNIEGILRDNSFNFIDSASNWTYLSSGIQTVVLLFEGSLINTHGVDGPYNVSLSLRDDSFNLLDTDTHLTIVYAWSQFTPPSTFDPPHSDYGLDVNSDGLFEYLVIIVSVNITSSGDYYIDGVLRDYTFSYIDSTSNWTYMSSGIQTVELRFEGCTIYQHGVNGSYTVTLGLRDASMNPLDSDTYDTSSYLITSFSSVMGTIISQWAGTIPVIDGTYSPGEWMDAEGVDLIVADPSNNLPAILFVKNDATRLFICYDGTGDTTQDISDKAAIAFDTGNDNVQSNGSEDQFLLRGTPSVNDVHYTYNSAASDWVLDCAPFNASLPDHSGLAGAIGFGPSENDATNHRVYEFCIPLALLNAVPGDIIGFLGASEPSPGIYDSSAFDYSTWPIYFTGPPALSMYGDLVLASDNQPHVDYVQIRDAPNGGGNLVEDATCDRGESNNYWCAGYNYSSGYVDDFSATWISSNASVVVVTSPGVYTSVTCDDTYVGTATITVNYSGIMNTTIINVRDLPRTTVVLSGTLGANGWYVSTVEANLSATDIMEGVNCTQYMMDSGSWHTYGSPFEIISEGQHTVSYYSVDMANNTEKTKSITVKIDKTRPTLTIMQTNGTTFTQATVTISWEGSDATSGIDYYAVSLDGSAFENLNAAITSKNLTGLSAGAHHLIVRAVDHAGLITEKRLDFSVDITAPGSSLLTEMWPWLILVAVVIAAMLILFLILSKRRKKDDDSATPPQMPPQAPPQNPPWQTPPQAPSP